MARIPEPARSTPFEFAHRKHSVIALDAFLVLNLARLD